MSGKLGDIQPKSIDQLETYFDMNRQGVVLPRRKWIVAPTWAPPAIPGVEALQTMLEKHALPRSWQLLMDFWQKAQCGTYFVKSPDWLEPPLLARRVPLRTEAAGVSITGTTATQVLSYTVPDRCVATFRAFGHGICQYEAWNRVLWTFLVNERPVEGYVQFRQQIGLFHQPTPLPAPVPLKHGDVFQVTAQLSAAGLSAEVFAYADIYTFTAKDISQSGTWTQYHKAH